MRKITAEERETLLKHPELVMFEPYKAMKYHRLSLWKALILPLVTLALILLWWWLCRDYVNSHPKLFAGIGCAALILSCALVPVLYLVLDDRTFKKAEKEHYVKQLRALLPPEPECGVARVLWVVPEKAEGGWILDGREEMFGFASCRNAFRIEADTDLAVISGGGFSAFVKRDPATESFYRPV